MKQNFPMISRVTFIWLLLFLTSGWLLPAEIAPSLTTAFKDGEGPNSFDFGLGITVDPEGAIYNTGWFGPPGTFGTVTLPQLAVDDAFNTFVAKYDKRGQLQWAHQAGGHGSSEGRSLKVDAFGNVFVTGYFDLGVAVFDTITISNSVSNGRSMFLAKYAPTGQIEWVRYTRLATNSAAAVGNAVDVDPAGNCYVTGFIYGEGFLDSVQVPTGDSINEWRDMVAKYSSDGTLQWVRTTDLEGESVGWGISVDTSGNAYVGGYFTDLVQAQGFSALVNVGGPDGFLAKYDAQGNVLWAVQASSPNGSANFTSVALDNSGNCFVAGAGATNLNFGSTGVHLTSPTFLAKYDSSGTLVWVTNAISVGHSTASADYGEPAGGISADGNGNCILGGNLLLSKIGPAGDLRWSQYAITNATAVNQSQVILGVSADRFSRNILLTGQFSGTNRFGQVLLAGGSDEFVAGLVRYYFPGEAIVPPIDPVLTNTLSGPSVSPTNLTFWDFSSQKLFAVSAGDITITWTRTNGQPLVIYATIEPIPKAQYFLGDVITPPALADVSQSAAAGPNVQPPGLTFWHGPTQRLYAAAPGACTITWKNSAGSPIPVNALNVWPTNVARFQNYVVNSLPVDLSGGGTFTGAQVLAQDAGVEVDGLAVANNLSFSASGPGRSLLVLSPGNVQATTNIYFQLIQSVLGTDPAFLFTNAVAIIGQEITNTAGFHDSSLGQPFILNPLSRYCALSNYYDRATRSGPIIPVNRDDPGTTADDMILVCYQKGTRLLDPLTGQLLASTVAWPYQPIRYDCQWPANPQKIVVSSGLGSGQLDPNHYHNWTIYFQNDPGQPGFNPNDEHAFVASTSNGPGIFALRSDLGAANTSDPYVLMAYRDGSDGDRPKIDVFKVEAGAFQYGGQAGALLQAPFPLSILQKCPESYGVQGPYWRDRKLDFWARAAGDDGGATNLILRFFYPLQPGFYFPSNYFAFFPPGVPLTNLPPAGSHFPWLDLAAGTPGVPINIGYTVTWPAAPELSVGETLVGAKFGLPEIGQQTSAEILYQQSAAMGLGNSVKLIDPTQVRKVSLPQLPADATTASQAGLTYFPTLPPQLRSRFWHDPISHTLNLQGLFIQPPAGEYYLLLNVLSSREKLLLLALSADPNWSTAVEALSAVAAQPIAVPPNTPFSHPLALTAGGATGGGYVTVAFNNSTNLNQPADPISLAVLKVACPLYRGQLVVIESDNPFDEKLTLRHSGDFAGAADNYVFEWRTLPPGADGLPQSGIPPEQWSLFIPMPASGQGALDITIAGPGLFTLSDNYFISRYHSLNPFSACGTNWSAWTDPQLAPGWVKRVLSAINPFEQRFRNYENATVNTIVSMIAQAGGPYQGAVPLNAAAANNLGLIEIYETVLRRGIAFSIEATPPVNYAPADDALLFAASRLSDLYMLLGNEAYAEASDPTIAISADPNTPIGIEAPSIHCFENQTASRLEEELKLLRGRDDELLPPPQTFPFYNRLIWNYTHGINGGEVAYSLKFDIHDVTGDGVVDENDAKQMYPMGHGDAWGHYLSAIKGYYRLLHNTNFTWVPRIEATLVGGVPVSVDYLDERKFAEAAAAKARAGADIVNLTYRSAYVEDPSGQWQGYQDANTNRAWGLSEWGSRAGQGALFDWAVGNALLPPLDTNPQHTGIQKIDRTTVTELRDISSAFLNIQDEVDKADTGLNPLGLAKNVVPFDIDPALIASGQTHFEQIYGRAVSAVNNALAVFNYANNATQLLRQQADSVANFQQEVQDREADFNSRLIEIFGYPYGDDIGPTGAYPVGYSGPDLYHYMYSDPSQIIGVPPPDTLTFVVTNADFLLGVDGTLTTTFFPVTYHVSVNGFGLVKPATWTGSRQAPGQIQMAHSDLLQAKARFENSLVEYEDLISQVEDQAGLLQAQYNLNEQQINVLNAGLNTQESLAAAIQEARARQLDFQSKAHLATAVANAASEAIPKVFGVIAGLAGGVIGDPLSALREAVLLAGNVTAGIMNQNADKQSLAELDQQQAKEIAQAETNIRLTTLNQDQAILQQLAQLEQLVRKEAPARLEIYTLQEAMQQAAGRYDSVLAQGQRLLEDRLRFRQQTAAQVQNFRYKDMAFRIFRNDALQKYRAQFDLAALYVYLAAAAYDFETNLKKGDPRGPGATFMTSIVKARSIGLIQNGVPITGNGANGDDLGLADPLARMFQNFGVLKGQLGFNNPETETGRFSLRSELFRIQAGAAGNKAWRDQLSQLVVSNILEVPTFKRYCIPFNPQLSVEPGIVIPFSTTINFGQNFFGWPAGGGDNSYDSSHFATKVRSVGVWFVNYNSLTLVNTPRVYLVPVGNDIMRTPGTDGSTREWKVLDQQLPVPFLANNTQLAAVDWIPIDNGLSSQFSAIRQFGSFLAYNDGGTFNASQTTSSSRLIGRSVWNTRWLLIIPAGTLLADRNEALQRFINGSLVNGQRDGNGVSDIKIFFQTYSYAGN
jgi:hypothetical protein